MLNKTTIYLFLIAIIFLVSCNSEKPKENNTKLIESERKNIEDTVQSSAKKKLPQKDTLLVFPFRDEPDSAFVSLKAYPLNYKLDIRYATNNNFTKTQLYECADCLLRKEVATALAKVALKTKEKGIGIVLFDCYRPLTVQQKMWKIVPNPIYVADPAKGSMHNRGNAVDLSLYNIESGKLLDMGTDFDYFGREAHHAFLDLAEEVLGNRKLLKESMENAGFKSITSEWWHYSYNKTVYPISRFPIPCN
jgi:D-alanyl-D-alanine dipeptidase